MNLRSSTALCAALFLPALAACQALQPDDPPAPRNETRLPGPGGAVAADERPARAGEYLLGLRGAPLRGEAERLLGAAGVELVRSYELLPGLHLVRSPLALEDLRDALGADVATLRPNRLLHATAAAGDARLLYPDDPLFVSQWALRNVGQAFAPGRSGTSGADVRAGVGWTRATSTRVVVAVLDSGLYLEHEDLAPSLWANALERDGVAGVDDDGNGYVDDVHGWSFVPRTVLPGALHAGSPDVADRDGHGTAVASILGAAGDNGRGMCGVAWKARLLPLAILARDEQGALTGDVAGAIAALEYAVKAGAQVSCAAWGAYAGSHPEDFEDLRRAIEAAGRAGHLVVASAGNGRAGEGADDDRDPFLPASFPLDCVVSVTGTDCEDGLPATFDRGAASVDLAAPAVLLLAAGLGAPDAYGLVGAGTSYAAPQVAGAAALWWERRPQASPSDVRRRLLATARVVPALDGRTASGGVLDLGALLAGRADAEPLPPPAAVEAAVPR